MFLLTLLVGLHFATRDALSATVAFPIYVDGSSDAVYIYYSEADLVSSVQMGALCGTFVKENAKELKITADEDIKTMATRICQAIAKHDHVDFEYDPNDFFVAEHITQSLQASQDEPIVSLENVLNFMKNGWTVIPNVLPVLKNDIVVKNINETLKRRKFEYLRDAFYMAKKKWDIDPEETRHLCGDFDFRYLNDNNLVDDVVAENFYKYGLAFLICTTNYHVVNRPELSIYVPFNQVINIHRINSVINNIAVSPRMGQIAAELLRHDHVRLYQTALFSKDNGGLNLQTQWHRDLNMAPINPRAGGSVTFWCPVYRKLDRLHGDSMLRFLKGSHRDISQKVWYEGVENMTSRYGGYGQARALDVGDCTAHHGWVLHCAPKQKSTSQVKDRLAIGFTYVAGDATVLTDLYGYTDPKRRCGFGDEDEYSYRDWIKDLKEGDVIDHPLLPLVFDSRPKSRD